MVRSGMTKEKLAQEPVSHVILGLGRLTLGWNTHEKKFSVKLNNIPYEQLDRFVKDS